jgi:anti-sigma factor RsiW
MFYPHRFSTLIDHVRHRLPWPRLWAAPDLTCSQVVALVADYLTGALISETRAAFEAHLQGCDHCIAFLTTYKQTITAVQSLRFDDLPEEMEARVRDFLANRVRRSGDDCWPRAGPAQPFFSRLIARLRRLATDAEPRRMILVPLVMVWVLYTCILFPSAASKTGEGERRSRRNAQLMRVEGDIHVASTAF